MSVAEITRPQAAAAEQFALAAKLDAEERYEEAVEQLRLAAKAGHLGAMTALAKRLLVGCDAPHAPQEALPLLMTACEQGDADALDLAATLTGAGAHTPKNWPQAFVLLQQAAERGSRHAREQMLVLAGDRKLAEEVRAGRADPEVWNRLRESIDFESWLKPPPSRKVNESPHVRACDSFTTPEICDWLMERARGRLRPAMMYDGKTKKPILLPTRTCSDYEFDIVAADLIVLLVRERASVLTGLPVPHMEPPRIFHYALGQEIKPHYDTCRIEGTGYANTGYDGDRIATLLIYLNDDFEGGELRFPRVDFQHKGKKGDVVYFYNLLPDGSPDRLSLHAGLPILQNEKWVVSQWIHDRVFGA